MSYTLFDAALDLAREIMDVKESTTTAGGSTTTLIDTTGLAAEYSDDHFNGGTIFVPARTGAANEMRKVTDYASGATVTFAAVSTAIASGNAYRLAPPEYPLYVLVQKVNAALKGIGPLPCATIVTCVADQSEYTSSDNSIFAEEIIQVEIAADSTEPYQWQPHNHWRQVEEAARHLYIEDGYVPDEALPMRITYRAYHAEVSAETAVINSIVHPDRLKWAAAMECYWWRMGRIRENDPTLQSRLATAQAISQMMASKHPIAGLQKTTYGSW